MKKRALSLTLALILCLGLTPMPSLAEETPTDVYQGDGYYITATKYGNQELARGISTAGNHISNFFLTA